MLDGYGYVAAWFATPLGATETCRAQSLGAGVGCRATPTVAPWSVMVDTSVFYPATFYNTQQQAVLCRPTGTTEPNQLQWGGYGTTWVSATSFLQIAGTNQANNNLVCGGVTSGITYYQLNTCIPFTVKVPKFAPTGNGNQTLRIGSHMYSVTQTDQGPTPGYTVYVDQVFIPHLIILVLLPRI